MELKLFEQLMVILLHQLRKMKHLFLFLLTLNSFLICSQQNKFELHDYHLGRAERLDSVQKFDEALIHIDSALSDFDYYPYDYFNAFMIAYHARDMKKAQDYLVEGTKKGRHL